MSQARRASETESNQQGSSRETDAILADRMWAGDSSAFEQIFRRYYEPLWRLVISYVESPETARELVHDLFYRMWTRRSECVVRTSLSAYLYTAARNGALNHLRHERQIVRWQDAVVRAGGEGGRTSRTSASAAADAAASAAEAACMGRAPRPADEEVVAAEESGAVRRAVAALPERQRQALALRWFHGLTNPEVAGILGLSTKAVESLLVRAFAALRGRLTILR